MAEFPLLLNAPDRAWAEHMETLVMRALGGRGSVALGLPGERLPNAPAAPGYAVTGVVVCDEPEDEMLSLILAALVDYGVVQRPLESGVTQIIVRPRDV